jgi:hypothetical protein
MKKLILTLCVLGLLAVGVIMFLLSHAAPENAPSAPIEVDLTEKLGG